MNQTANNMLFMSTYECYKQTKEVGYEFIGYLVTDEELDNFSKLYYNIDEHTEFTRSEFLRLTGFKGMDYCSHSEYRLIN